MAGDKETIRVEIVERKSSGWAAFGRQVPLISALFAIAFSSYEAYQTREHDRMAEMPIINGYANFTTGGTDDVCLGVGNNGLGPAIVKEYAAFIDGRELRAQTSNELVAATKKFPDVCNAKDAKLPVTFPYWVYLKDGSSLVPNSATIFFGTGGDTNCNLDVMKAFAARIAVTMRVCSVYTMNDSDCPKICVSHPDRACQSLGMKSL